MWGNTDFSKLRIEFDAENLHVAVLNANRMVFFESFPSHQHGFYELHYIFGGKGTLICGGKSLPLYPGVLYLNGRNISHEQLTDSADIMMEYSVSFDIQPSGNSKNSFTAGLSGMELWYGEDKNEIDVLFREIERELEEKKPGGVTVIRNLLSAVFIKMLRNFSAEDNSHDTFASLPGDRRKFIMDEAFIYDYRDMTLTSLARILNLSERQTIRDIREYYGMTFTDFRRQSRLSAAARFLAENKLSVPEISEKVGFTGIPYFRRLFRQAYGVTPAEYRKNCLKEQPHLR